MELLLNLVWVIVATAVLYAWGRRRNHSQARPQLVVLLCLLALLFPVISATDDLHAMSSEMEDSTSVRRSLKQMVVARSFGQIAVYTAPALVKWMSESSPIVELGPITAVDNVSRTPSQPFALHSNRAPPVSDHA
jgi:hypothetical protein